ncbi:MAG: MMPL family transporter, partial [Bacteroidota bacterium]
MLNLFLDKVIAYPKTVLLLILVGTFAATLGLTKLEVNSEFSADLPQDDPMVISNNTINDVFGQSSFVWIGIESDNVYQKRTLEKVQGISEALKTIGPVIDDEVKSLTTINNIKGVEEGLEVGPYLTEIPSSAAEFAQLSKDIRNDNLINGHLVSEDGTFTVIAANMEEGYSSAKMYEELQKVKAAFEGPEKIYLASDFIQFKEVDNGIQVDAPRLMPLALLLILIGYFFTFRSWRGVWLPFAVVILSIIWTMGAMGWIGFPMTVVSSCIPVLMIAVSSSYGIHLLHRYYEDIEGRDNTAGVREAFHKIGPAIFMTGITSAVGTATLLVFKVGVIRQFGVTTSIGMLIVLLLSLTFVPAILTVLKREENNYLTKGTLDNPFFRSLANFAIQSRQVVLLGTVVIGLVSVWGMTKINIGDDLAQYFSPNHIVNQTFDAFNTKLNGAKYIEIMVDAQEVDGVKSPNMLREIEAFQQYAESLPHVGKTSSFVDIIKRINQELHASNPDYLRVPDSQNAVSQFMLLYSLSGAPGDFSSIVDYDYQRTKVKVMVNSSKQEDHLAIVKALQNYEPAYLKDDFQFSIGGDTVRRLAYIKYIVEGKILNMIVAILIVLLFCSLIFRSLKTGLITIVPLVFSSLVTFGLMGFLGIRLEMATAIITAIGIGIGVDFAIHFIMRFREES